jgi:hypothetical protein
MQLAHEQLVSRNTSSFKWYLGRAPRPLELKRIIACMRASRLCLYLNDMRLSSELTRELLHYCAQSAEDINIDLSRSTYDGCKGIRQLCIGRKEASNTLTRLALTFETSRAYIDSLVHTVLRYGSTPCVHLNFQRCQLKSKNTKTDREDLLRPVIRECHINFDRCYRRRGDAVMRSLSRVWGKSQMEEFGISFQSSDVLDLMNLVFPKTDSVSVKYRIPTQQASVLCASVQSLGYVFARYRQSFREVACMFGCKHDLKAHKENVDVILEDHSCQLAHEMIASLCFEAPVSLEKITSLWHFQGHKLSLSGFMRDPDEFSKLLHGIQDVNSLSISVQCSSNVSSLSLILPRICGSIELSLHFTTKSAPRLDMVWEGKSKTISIMIQAAPMCSLRDKRLMDIPAIVSTALDALQEGGHASLDFREQCVELYTLKRVLAFPSHKSCTIRMCFLHCDLELGGETCNNLQNVIYAFQGHMLRRMDLLIIGNKSMAVPDTINIGNLQAKIM